MRCNRASVEVQRQDKHHAIEANSQGQIDDAAKPEVPAREQLKVDKRLFYQHIDEDAKRTAMGHLSSLFEVQEEAMSDNE